RLEIADGFPKRRQQLGGNLQARFSRRPAAGQAKQFKFILAEAGGRLLFLQPNPRRFRARAQMMARGSVRANDHASSERAPPLSSPQLEGSGSYELIIVEMGVNTERFHRTAGLRVR